MHIYLHCKHDPTKHTHSTQHTNRHNLTTTRRRRSSHLHTDVHVRANLRATSGTRKRCYVMRSKPMCQSGTTPPARRGESEKCLIQIKHQCDVWNQVISHRLIIDFMFVYIPIRISNTIHIRYSLNLNYKWRKSV